jgi:hypothetical protein
MAEGKSRSQARRPLSIEAAPVGDRWWRSAIEGGKSELQRAVRRVTPGQGNLTE